MTTSNGHHETMAGAPSETRGSSLDRLLGVIDLFSAEKPIWTLEQIGACFGTSRSTTYRYLKELADSGFVASIGRRGFVLGPRIMELDRQIRLCDPLMASARDVMQSSAAEIGSGVLLLTGRYGEQFICTHSAPERPDVTVTYSRGRTLPIFTGSTSRTILAHLPHRTLTRLFQRERAAIAAAGLGDDWAEFAGHLAEIRRAGIYVTEGAIDPGTLCAAVPLFRAPGEVVGALCLVQKDRGQGVSDAARAVLRAAAATISTRLGVLFDRLSERPAGFSPSVPQSVAETASLGRSGETGP